MLIAEVDLLPWMLGDVAVPRLRLVGSDILFEIGKSGKTNWDELNSFDTAAGGAAPAAAVEEKTSFTVILEDGGAEKIKVIKEVRAITGLGLKEAKAIVDEAPKPIKEGCTKEEAEELKEKLEAAGATVKLA